MTASAKESFIPNFVNALKPKKRLKVSEWAAAHRVLSSKASNEPGPWKNGRTPHLVEPMDNLSAHSSIERTTLMFAVQTAKTEAGLNWLGYIADHNPAPTLIVLPTINVRKRWHNQRLAPMIEESPRLNSIYDIKRTRNSSNSGDTKDFPGGIFILGGANSAASLASMPIQNVLMDEVDTYPRDVQGKGDTVGVIDMRQANFPWRKTLIVSSPTIKGASIIEDQYIQGDQRKYHVPCYECGVRSWLKWENFFYNKLVTYAYYICEHCEGVIEESKKTDFLENGIWVPQNPIIKLHRSYQLSALYSPSGLGFTWLELAKKWIEAQSDRVKNKRFTNTSKAETWEDLSATILYEELKARAGQWQARTLPNGVLIIVAGVDTQDDRLEIKILGIGRDQKEWILDYIILPGNPGQDKIWSKLSEILNTPFYNEFGHKMNILATGIDVMGHHTNDVYMYVRSKPAMRVMAMFGKNTPGGPILAGRPKEMDINWKGKVIKSGVKLWRVGVDTAKHRLFERLKSDEDQPESNRKIHFNIDLDEDYFKGLCAEVYDPELNRFVQKGGQRNEPIDTFNYAVAASHHPEIRAHVMQPKDWDRLELALGYKDAEKEVVAPEPEPEQKVKYRRNGSQRTKKRGGFAKNY